MAINPLGVAIIGCGLIGKRRAAQVAQDSEARLHCVVDTDRKSAEIVQNSTRCAIFSNWQDAIASSEVHAVIISTPNHLLAEIAIAALDFGKHILVEKPLGRNGGEAAAILSAARRSPHFTVVKTGFNHRFHPAISQAKELLEKGEIGKLLSLRGRYGHGGRAGMEKEWRASKTLCGGGELLDQGVHLIDLIQWFGGEIVELTGKVETQFWEMEVEDNAYVIAKTAQNANALFHVSWTNWKNLFSFEIFGSKGYLHIQGLGGSYGTETLEIGIRRPEGGKPDIRSLEFPGEDLSWKWEWEEFKSAIFQKRQPLGNGEDGYRANLVVDAIYQSHQEQKQVRLYEQSALSR